MDSAWSRLPRDRRRRGRVGWDEYERIVLAAGYKDVRSVNRFVVGEPEPALQKDGDTVVLTERGRSGAEFFTTYWLPRLLAGDASWPGPSASALLHSAEKTGSAEPAQPAGAQRTRRLTAAVSHEPPWYVARCLEVEVTSQGTTLDDALANLREALELYFEDTPAPPALAAPIIASVEVAA